MKKDINFIQFKKDIIKIKKILIKWQVKLKDKPYKWVEDRLFDALLNINYIEDKFT
jgi:hypothetical protein